MTKSIISVLRRGNYADGSDDKIERYEVEKLKKYDSVLIAYKDGCKIIIPSDLVVGIVTSEDLNSEL